MIVDLGEYRLIPEIHVSLIKDNKTAVKTADYLPYVLPFQSERGRVAGIGEDKSLCTVLLAELNELVRVDSEVRLLLIGGNVHLVELGVELVHREVVGDIHDSVPCLEEAALDYADELVGTVSGADKLLRNTVKLRKCPYRSC